MIRYSWTQPCCTNCWEQRNPGRAPARVVEVLRESEVCCHCGHGTRGGIYVRVDPTTVPRPTLEKE